MKEEVENPERFEIGKLSDESNAQFTANYLLKSYKIDINYLIDEAIKDMIINDNIDEKYQKAFEARIKQLKKVAKSKDNPLVLKKVTDYLRNEPKGIKQAVIIKLRASEHRLLEEIKALRKELCEDISYLNTVEKLLNTHDHP